MKDFFKNKVVTALVVTATILLAGVAVFTAVRLYQLRQQPVAPSAPESEPRATQEPKACELLTFTLTKQSPTPTEPGPTSTPTNTPTNTPVPSGTPSPTATPTEPGRGGEPSPTPTPTVTNVPNPTATPTTGEIAAVSPTPEGANLPAAGIGTPTILLGIFAALIITISFAVIL